MNLRLARHCMTHLMTLNCGIFPICIIVFRHICSLCKCESKRYAGTEQKFDFLCTFVIVYDIIEIRVTGKY